MEKTYDPTTTCKASWTITKIIWWDMTIHNCWYYYRFRLNNWENEYVVRGLERNDIWYGSWCENWFYVFSWWQLPNVWDQMYIIAQYSDARIIEQSKESFKKFEKTLPDCPITADGSPSYDEYNWADKCKVSWKIEEVARSFTDICWLNLGIKVKNWDETYIVWWREYFTWKGVSICLWWWNGEQQIDSTDWKITTQINKWDDFYAVLNQKDNTILRYWKDEYNADTSMSICSGATIKQIQSFKSWITESELIRIMKAVEKDVERSDPFHYNFGKWHNVWITKTLSWNTQSWTTNIDKKEENTKIVYVKPKINTVKVYSPKPMIIQNTESKIVDTNWEASTWTFTWKIKEQEIINWSELKEVNTKNEKDEIITETKSVNSVNQEQSWNINYFWVIWIIIIILIVSMYLILKKTKK